MPCNEKDCSEFHIENPSTGFCIKKNSFLASIIQKKKKDVENINEMEQDILLNEKKLTHNTLEKNINDIKNLEFIVNDLQNKINTLFEKINFFENKITNIENVIDEKKNQKHQLKATDFLNVNSEKIKCIQILKNEFGIVCHTEPNHKHNKIIKKAINIVEKNAQNGCVTNITKEFLFELNVI